MSACHVDGDASVVIDIVLLNCQSGIGIKIVGGKLTDGPSYGIFVKTIFPASPASRDGRLREGDKILKVNKEDVTSVMHEKAMIVLLHAARTGKVKFLIDRSSSSKEQYKHLLDTLNPQLLPIKYPSTPPQLHQPSRDAVVTSPTTVEKRSWVLANDRMSPVSPGRLSPNLGTASDASTQARPLTDLEEKADVVDKKSSKRLSNEELPLSLGESMGDSGLHSSSPTSPNISHASVANINLRNGLGMSITGGSNHANGPNVIVGELINGGDVQCDGRIKKGDRIVGINGESFLDVSHEEAKIKLTQLKLREGNEFKITYMNSGKLDLDSGTPEVKFENQTNLSMEESLENDKSLESSKAADFDENCNSIGIKQGKHEHFSTTLQAPIQPSSVPFYLQQDLVFSPELPSAKTTLSAKTPKRQLSLAPSSKLRVEKLEVALTYLGIQLSPQQQDKIRSKLHVDKAGLVSYGEFVKVAEETLDVEPLRQSQVLSEGKLRYALHNAEKNGVVAHHTVYGTSDPQVVEDLRRQRDNALAEVRRLQKCLSEKECTKLAEADQLDSFKRTANEVLEESLALKDQVFLASQAKEAAMIRDEEYEEVIRLLEDELRYVKARGTPEEQELQDFQKKVVVLGCQLRKMEVVKRTYKVATGRLLGFAEHVHDCLRKDILSESKTLSSNHSPQENDFHKEDEHHESSQPPRYLSHRHTSQKLADQACDVLCGVRTLLEEEPLPFGWEEAYTSDGERYFINHVQQITSWLHPVTHTTMERKEDV